MSKFYSTTYSVEHYNKLCNSYAMRDKLVPHKDKSDYIDFITRTVVFHGGLIGPLSKAALYFANNIRVVTGNDFLKRSVEKTLGELDSFGVLVKAWLSAFMFDTVSITYFPEQDIIMTCKECKHVFTVNSKDYKYPFKIVDLRFEDDPVRKLRTDGKLNPLEKRQHPRNFGVKCECDNCGSLIVDSPETSWNLSRAGKLTLLNPKLCVIETNDVGKDRLVIDPRYYSGALALNKELEWFHLSGVPWNLACTYASKDRLYYPDEDWYILYSMREVASLGTTGAAVAPMLSCVSDTISMDVYKMGNEGLALSKVDPLYMVGPNNTEGPAFEGVSLSQFKDFLVGGIKAHHEGDINRILVSAAPVDVQPLFGDGKRFMHVQELVTYQNMALGGLGLSSSSLDGASGFTMDPVMMDTWNKLINVMNVKYLSLHNNILKLISRSYAAAADSSRAEDKVTLWLPQLSQLNGGVNMDAKWKMAQSGELPFEEFTRDLGIPDPELWRGALLENEKARLRFERRKERILDEVQRNELEKMQESDVSGGPNMALARQQLVQEAESLAEQLMHVGNDDRQSYLRQIQKEDYVLHAILVRKIEELRNLQYRMQQG